MRCKPARWLWGVVPIVALSWLAIQIEREAIEIELRTRIAELLQQQGLAWASLAMSGRDAALAGEAADESEQRRAVQAVRGVWGVRALDDRTRLLDEEKNYLWAAQLRDNRLRLTGFVPNDATRRAIVGAAKATFPGREIDDRMKLARGSPNQDVWLGGISFGLRQLGGLKSNGRIDLDGASLRVEGEAEDVDTYRSIKSALANNLPTGFRLREDKVSPPLVKPYTWSARFAGKELRLSGHVPSEELRRDLMATATKAFPGTAVVDDMQPASGQPKNWPAAMTVAIAKLGLLEEGSVDVRDYQLTIVGLAREEATANAVRRQMKVAAPAGFKITDQIKFREPKPASPYVTTLDVEADVSTLTGYAPSESERAALVDAVRTRLLGRRIEDRLQVAVGATAKWIACLEAGVAGLARIGGGRLSLSGRRLELAGQLDEEELAGVVQAAVRSALNGACDAEFNIKVVEGPEPSAAWRAARGAGEVVLEGEAPDQASKTSLAAAAGRLFPGERVLDRMQVATDVRSSRRWPSVANAGLKMLTQLRTGEALLKGQQLTVRGVADDEALAAAIRGQLAGELARGYRAEHAIEVRAVPEPSAKGKNSDERQASATRCQDLLRSVAQNGVITFKRGSAEIDAGSVPTLARLAEVASSCPTVRVEIGGHTDPEGLPERNQVLSTRRARAVVSYLTGVGVPASRLTAAGYGDSRPMMPNDTAENRAKNRRIEFSVRTQ